MAEEYKIRVVVDPSPATSGTDKVVKGLDDVEKKAGSVGSAIKRALAFVGVTVGIREVVRLGDSFVDLQNKIRTVISSEDQLAGTTRKVFEIANKTRLSVEATAQGFTRFTRATETLGLSQAEVLRLTKSVNEAIILSGATGAEASAGLIQLSQGLAAGALRGDELRSVLEQLGGVAKVIADGMGVPISQLKTLGEQGKLTTQVIVDAFKKAQRELDDGLAKSVPTVNQSLGILRNNFIEFVGEIQTGTGAFSAISRAITFVANNLGVLLAVAISFAAFWTGTLLASLGTSIIAGAAAAVGGLTAAFSALGVVIAANPIGAVVVAMTAAITIVLTFKDSFDELATSIGNAWGRLTDWIVGVENAEISTRKYHQALIVLAKDLDEADAQAERLANTRRAGAESPLDQSYVRAVEKQRKESAEARRQEIDDLESLRRKLDPVYERQQQILEVYGQLNAARAHGLITGQQEIDLQTAYLGTLPELIDLKKRQLDIERAYNAEKERSRFGVSAGGGLGGVSLFETSNNLFRENAKAQEDAAKKADAAAAEAIRKQERLASSAEKTVLTFDQLADTIDSKVNSSIVSMGENFIDAALSGEQGFSEMASSMVKELQKVLLKALILKAILAGINASSGGSGESAAAGVITKLFGFATGGSFEVGGNGGTDSQFVAFKATPGERVDISTPAQQEAQRSSSPPIVNNKIVLVSNMREAALEAMRSDEGERVTINTLGRNHEALRRFSGRR